jgi:hypothetical protein
LAAFDEAVLLRSGDDAPATGMPQRDAEQQTASAASFDQWGVDLSDRGAQLLAADGGVGDESRAIDLAEHGQGGRRRERIAAEGRAVRARVEEVAGGAEGDERADREAAADALGDGDRVGHDVLVLEGEPGAGATRARLDLIDDQQRTVTRGDLACRGEVSLRQRHDPASPLIGSTNRAATSSSMAASRASTVESRNSTPGPSAGTVPACTAFR